MVYLLHFSIPYPRDRRGWVQHYIGFTGNLRNRIQYHKSGQGSPFISAIHKSGRRIVISRRWKNGTRTLERILKENKNAARLCPICSGRSAYNRFREGSTRFINLVTKIRPSGINSPNRSRMGPGSNDQKKGPRDGDEARLSFA